MAVDDVSAELDTPRDATADAVEELTDAHAEIAALRGQVCRLVSGHAIESSMRTRALAAERLLADERDVNAETSRDLDALLTALGAEVTPGGQTLESCHARRVADGLRRARELGAASEVPADVEAAIRVLVDGVHFCALEIDDPKAAEGSPGFPGWPDMGAPMVIAFRAAIAKAIADGRADIQAAPHDVEVAIADLVAASRDLEVYAEGKVTAKRTRSAERSFGRARTAIRAAIAAEIERARAEVRGEAKAAPATVGDFVIEYADPIAPSVWIGPEKPTHKIRQLRAGRVRSWSSGGGWDAWGTAMMRVDFGLPARLITDVAEAEADPSSRWPIDRPPVCSTCNDTHAMTLGDRTVMCTRCPTPCHACRAGGNGPFCGSTPCPCKCHAKIGGGS